MIGETFETLEADALDAVRLEQAVASCDDAAISAYGVAVEAMERLYRIFDRRLREECGITAAWFEALLRIGRSGGRMTMSELASQLALTNGGVTRMVDRMAEAGLLHREACASDRRVAYAALTSEGLDMWQRASDLHVRDLRAEFTGRMTAQELEMVVAVMDRLRRPAARPATT